MQQEHTLHEAQPMHFRQLPLCNNNIQRLHSGIYQAIDAFSNRKAPLPILSPNFMIARSPMMFAGAYPGGAGSMDTFPTCLISTHSFPVSSSITRPMLLSK